MLLEKNSYLGALNIRFVTSENGNVGAITNIEGNTLKNRTTNSSGTVITFALPAGTNTVIGSIEDLANRRVFFFVKNNTAASNAIYCYDSVADLIYTVITNAQITINPSASDSLNFTNYIHSIDILGSLLCWTNGTSDPRSINADAAIKMNHPTYVASFAYTNPLAFEQTTVIKAPPLFALNVTKFYDSSYTNNYIKASSFKFLYQYNYNDNQISALSTHSDIIAYSGALSTNNAITVTIPSLEIIPKDVSTIDIIVKINDDSNVTIVKTFDRTKDDFTAELSFVYYNDVIGIAVDTIQAGTSFHNVPLISKTLTFAKNRLFLANNTNGYSTPTVSSLSVSPSILTPTSGGTVSCTWKYMTLQYSLGGTNHTENIYYAYNAANTPKTCFFYLSAFHTATPAGSYLESNATTVYNTEVNLAYWYMRNYSPSVGGSWNMYTGYVPTYTSTGLTTVITQPSNALDGVSAFKSGSTYSVGISFYDRFRRKCGVVDAGIKSGVAIKQAPKVTIPARLFNATTFSNTIDWTLSNTNALNEIPSWAAYYQINITKSLLTRFFIQDYSLAVYYTTKTTTTATSGTPSVTSYVHAGGSYAAGTFYATTIDLTRLTSGGRGYTYQAGDLVKLTRVDGGVEYKYNLQILGQDGKYLMLSPTDVGTLSSSSEMLYEIYTPYQASVTEPYFESGSLMKISNALSSSRSYSTLTGSLLGDIYPTFVVYTPNTYSIETMNPNPTYWQEWQTNTGWVNIITSLSQTNKKNSIRFSDPIIIGTKINGLNAFQSLNDTELPLELNGIQKITLTSKVQQEGTVMLAVGLSETTSIYLGESQIFDSTGASFIAKTTGVIGQVNTLKGSYGTVNPESVFKWEGDVYWFDANKGSVVRYGNNGLFPISDYKMRKYFVRLGDLVLKNNSQVLMSIDPYHEEVLLTVVQSTSSMLNTTLPDMVLSTQSVTVDSSTNITPTFSSGKCYKLPSGVTATYNGEVITGVFMPITGSSTLHITAGAAIADVITISEVLRALYDPYDGQGGTLAFQPTINKWTSKYSYTPESLTMVSNRLVTFSAGNIYMHDSSVFNTWYGKSYDSAIAFVHNEAGNSIKSYDSIAVEGDKPDRIHLRSEVPNVQSSDLISDDFKSLEGVWYAPILRDRLSPNTGSSDYNINLLTGDKIRAEALKLQVVYTQPTTIKQLKFVDINFDPSRGQSV